MATIVSFGAWVQQRRNTLGLTRAALARQVGCSSVTIKKIERDERRPSVQIAELLAEHLQIPTAGYADFIRRARGEFVEHLGSPTELSWMEASDDKPKHNLPAQPTRFVGRSAELTTLTTLLNDPDQRLITILGPGGMGKTRLALALAEQQLTKQRFQHGIFFVPLAPLSEATQIVPTLAEAMSFPLDTGGEQRRPAKQQVLDYLRQKKMLLIFDNCEHLLDDIEIVADILQTAAQVTIIATSRERLHLHQEQLFTLYGLDIPEIEQFEKLTRSAAVQLFLQSAQRVKHDFELQKTDEPQLAHICQLVAGMPLGLELAAGWVEMLSPADIAQEIEQSIDFLETEVRNVPMRQRSMRAIFDSSWRRLSSAEQAILLQLSVFRGGFTRQAGQAITGISLRTLGHLVSKSLLQYDQTQDRYFIHELLRQYLRGRLAEDDEREKAAISQHSLYYLNTLHEQETKLKGHKQKATIAAIESDIENLRSAWLWAIEQEQYEHLVNAIETFGLFHNWQGRFEDGAMLFQTLLDALTLQPLGSNERLVILAYGWASLFQHELGDVSSAVLLVEQAMHVLTGESSINDNLQHGQGFIHFLMGRYAIGNDYSKAAEELATSLEIFRTLDNTWACGRVLRFLGNVATNIGDHDLATHYLNESIKLHRLMGDARGLVNATLYASTNARFNGNHLDAVTLAEESLDIAREVGDVLQIAFALHNLAFSYTFGSGRLTEALALQRQSTDMMVALAYPVYLVHTEFHFGLQLLLSGQPQEAASHFKIGIASAQQIQHTELEAMCWSELGVALTLLGNLREGEQNLQRAWAIFSKIDRLDSLVAFALLLLIRVDYDSPSTLAVEAVKLLRLGHEKRAFYVFWYGLKLTLALLVRTSNRDDSQIPLGHILALEVMAAIKEKYQELDFELWSFAGEKYERILQQLPEEVVAAAQERGRKLD